jgi:hypothetical protein
MSRLWKNLRTNWMYWRFRYITRNRLRLKSWWARRRQTISVPRGPRTPYGPGAGYRPRGGATFVYRRSSGRAWALLLDMVLALTALRVWADSTYINPTVVYGIGALVVVGAVYLALRKL